MLEATLILLNSLWFQMYNSHHGQLARSKKSIADPTVEMGSFKYYEDAFNWKLKKKKKESQSDSTS